MTTHACPRCGLESRCSHGNWPDRHPAAAVTLAVIVLATVCAYPWLLAVAAVGGGVYWASRERRRREALAARADWEHRALMAAPLKWPPALSERNSSAGRKYETVRPSPTPRRRGADHWSTTEPMRR